VTEREHLEDLGIDGMIILNNMDPKKDGGVDWIDVACDRCKWRCLVSTVTKL
jgi:hypothetical protein